MDRATAAAPEQPPGGNRAERPQSGNGPSGPQSGSRAPRETRRVGGAAMRLRARRLGAAANLSIARSSPSSPSAPISFRATAAIALTLSTFASLCVPHPYGGRTAYRFGAHRTAVSDALHCSV